MSLEITDYNSLADFQPTGRPNYALLREAREMLAQIPEPQFDLASIVAEGCDIKSGVGSIALDGDLDSCGTIACAAGWLALTPRFQALGLTVLPESRFDAARLVYKGIDTDETCNYDLAMAPLFNITHKQAERLFSTRYDCSDDDYDEPEADESVSDKELFLARIDRLLAAETYAE